MGGFTTSKPIFARWSSQYEAEAAPRQGDCHR